jgi:hypothetical protein
MRSAPAAVAPAGAGRRIAGAGSDVALGGGIFCTGFSRAQRYGRHVILVGAAVVDAIYLLLLAALYLATHGLVWALSRLGRPT